MIVVNELHYIVWHVVWMISEDGLTSTVEQRERGEVSGKYTTYKSMTTQENILSGAAHDAFNAYCWDALTRGSRSMMRSHAANCGVEI